MAEKTLIWTTELFYETVRFADEVKLVELIQTSSGEKIRQIELGRKYPLYRMLFGVQIGSGQISIRQIIERDALALMEDFTVLRRKGKTVEPETRSDTEAMVRTAEKLGLEMPDRRVIAGYELNSELIRFLREDFDVIQFKYKDSPENIFFLYRLYFTRFHGGLYLVVEKRI
jgi:hypothetical protein